MHDFGVTQTHSIILDLPLSLSPWNLLSLQPVVKFDQSKPSRFGLVPRYFDGNNKKEVMWFEDEEACCIFRMSLRCFDC
jgi:carotenoid cleavage dioxygenase-like enzyme